MAHLCIIHRIYDDCIIELWYIMPEAFNMVMRQWKQLVLRCPFETTWFHSKEEQIRQDNGGSLGTGGMSIFVYRSKFYQYRLVYFICILCRKFLCVSLLSFSEREYLIVQNQRQKISVFRRRISRNDLTGPLNKTLTTSIFMWHKGSNLRLSLYSFSKDLTLSLLQFFFLNKLSHERK